MSNNIPVNGWPQLKDLEAVQPILNRLDKIEAWKRTVKEETFTGDDITIENALALPARSLITSINAIQDLHGLPFPYVGGAYKNKLPNLYTSKSSAGINYDVYDNGAVHAHGTSTNISAFNLGTFNLNDNSYIINGCPSGGGSSTYELQVVTSDNITYRDYGSGASFPANGTVAGQILVRNGITIDKVFYPMIRLASESDPTFAPYSNICPISGRDRVVVDDTGRNIWDEQWEVGMISSDNGQNVAANDTIRSKNYIPVTPSTNFYIRCLQGVVMLFYAGDKSYITYQNLNNGGAFTMPQNAKYIRFRTYVAYGTTYHNDICINISDASFNGQYVPYAHSSATLQLGTTVYGADINWDTGVMTVKTALKIYDGSETWTQNPSFTYTYYAAKPSDISSDVDGTISNQYLRVPYLGDVDAGFGIGSNLNVRDTVHATSLSDWQTYVTNHPIQIEYPLATPTTLQLTPTQLQMLKGYNRVTLSDGYGTIELKALTGANWS